MFLLHNITGIDTITIALLPAVTNVHQIKRHTMFFVKDTDALFVAKKHHYCFEIIMYLQKYVYTFNIRL